MYYAHKAIEATIPPTTTTFTMLCINIDTVGRLAERGYNVSCMRNANNSFFIGAVDRWNIIYVLKFVASPE